MFIGHHAVAFGAKRFAPRVQLGVLMAAATLLDLLWPLFCLAGVEHFRVDPGNTRFTPLDFFDYPWTHSLAMVLAWSLLAAITYALAKKSIRDAAIIGIAVLSHWILDFLTHRPDLPLWPGGPKAGLGLWNSVPATIVVEGALFAIGIALYRPTRRLWVLVAFLVVIYAANLFGPPPPGWRPVSYTALAAWIFVPWAWWIDRPRQARS